MKLVSPGLRGKFVGALLIAAVLPLLVGLVFLETLGYRHILAERGKFHQMQALTLVRALDLASKAQAAQFRSWVAVDPLIVRFVAGKNRALAGMDPGQIAVWVAVGLAFFTILFGTRNLDANEQHHGVVMAIAVEAIVKLVALLAVVPVWALTKPL